MFRPVTTPPPRKGGRPRLAVEELDRRLVPATFHVAPDGNNATGTGSAAAPYRTVQYAINQAASTPGPHVVKAAAGTYATAGVDLAVTVNDPDLAGLQLLGGWDRATFSGRVPGSTVYVPQSAGAAGTADVDVRNPDVTIDGFTFVFDGTPGAGGTRAGGGLSSNSSGLTLNQNTLEAGIRSGTATYAFRTGVTNQTGLRVTGNAILSNAGTAFTFATSAGGMFLSTDVGRTTPIVISGNTIAGPNLGSALIINDGCSNVTVSGNAIGRTGTVMTGLPLIDVRQSTAAGPTQTGLVFAGNTIDGGGATYRGIYLTGRDNNAAQLLNGVTITGNVIRGVTRGIDAGFPQVQAAGAVVRGNSIADLSTTGPANAPVVWSGTGTLDLAGNWWGTAVGPEPTDLATPLAIDALPFGGTSAVRIGSFLAAGTDADPAGPGFQVPAVTEVWVARPDAALPARVRGSVRAGVAGADLGRTVRIAAGTFAENVVIGTGLALIGAGPDTVLAPAGGTGIAVAGAGAATIQGLRISGADTALSASGLTELTLAGVTLSGNGSGGTLSGIPTIHFRTAGGAADVLTVTPTGFGVQGQDAFSFSGASTLTVGTDDGDDTIRITPSAATTFHVDGGGGEDTLVVDAGGLATAIDSTRAAVAGRPAVGLAGVERAGVPTKLAGVPFAPGVADATLLTFPAGDPAQLAPGVVFSLIGAPAGAAIDPATGVFTWTPGEALAPGAYPVTVRADDGAVAVDLAMTVVVSEGNQSPVLAGVPTGTASVPEGAPYTFTATATDPDVPTQSLTLSAAEDLPAGAAFEPATGVFAWTPDETQGGATYSFIVRVTDGTQAVDQAVTLAVGEVNEAPALAGVPTGLVSLDEGTPYAFTASATDPDAPAQPLTLSVGGTLPAGAAFDPATGLFTWTPGEDAGGATFTFAVQASDGDRTDARPVTIRVAEVNAAPTLGGVAATYSAAEHEPLTFTATGADADLPTQSLTYSLVGAVPGGAAIDSAGFFTWVPDETDGGTSHSFAVRVSDGALTADLPVTVHVAETNTAPRLAGVPVGPVALAEGHPYTFAASATDPDAPTQSLTLSAAEDLPAGAAFEPATGVFSWTPDELQGGATYSFTVRVSDGTQVVEEAVTLAVGEVNEAPGLAGVPAALAVAEGTESTFAATATDPDAPAQVLAFELVDAPAGAAIDPVTGAFTWTPTEAQGGRTYAFRVRVSDGAAVAERPVSADVAEVNTAPVLAAVPAGPVAAVRGDVVRFTAVATDPDVATDGSGDLRYGLAGAPAAAALDPVTGAFVWDTAAAGPGTYEFRVLVMDAGSPAQGDVRSVTVVVAEAALDAGGLQVGGTPGADTIWVTRGRDHATLVVDVNGVRVGSFPLAAVTGRIVVAGGAGNDRVWIGSGVRIGADVFGGEGRDVLVGGGGDDLLDGGAGADVLIGGAGADTLFGGPGRDVLWGGAGVDLTDWTRGEDVLMSPPFRRYWFLTHRKIED
jgi:Ca2+-binding RTX toxin-like protein